MGCVKKLGDGRTPITEKSNLSLGLKITKASLEPVGSLSCGITVLLEELQKAGEKQYVCRGITQLLSPSPSNHSSVPPPGWT